MQLSPSSSGGAIRSYSAQPTLPAGLILNTITGVISGTPTAVTPQATYTITASNSAGSATTGLTITVQATEALPGGLSYECPICSFAAGQLILPLIPTIDEGQITNFIVSPALPAGLSLDPSTGIISGTPASVSAQTTYTVTGSNSAGSVTTGLILTITATTQRPIVLHYDSPAYTFVAGQPITITPEFIGGEITECSVEPPLMDGLSMDEQNCIISGTAVGSPDPTYIVTASNAAGSVETPVTLVETDTLQAPAAFNYGGTIFTFTVNKPLVTLLAPQSDTGLSINTKYSITPALPQGMELDPVSGKIGGTPTVLTPKTTYTITATNSAGASTSTTINLTIQIAQNGFVGTFAGVDVYSFNYFWTKITSGTAFDYPSARAYCKTTISQALGGEWELPGSGQLIFSLVAPIIEKAPGFEKWALGSIWIEDSGNPKILSSFNLAELTQFSSFNLANLPPLKVSAGNGLNPVGTFQVTCFKDK